MSSSSSCSSSSSSIPERINALLHRDPVSTIFYCLFWSYFWVFVAPIAFVTLHAMAAIRFASWCIGRYDKDSEMYNPAKRQDLELAVVITGCDSGFGKEIALWAAQEGFTVFAGCLQKESFAHFNGMEDSIAPLVMDVTSDEDVANAQKAVSDWLKREGTTGGNSNGKKRRFLHAIINNAGIAQSGLVDWLDLSAYEKVMNVNFFGAVRVCKAFLPILKEQAIMVGEQNNARPSFFFGGGRILNVTSTAGLLPGGVISSTYAASKNACQAFSGSLREELKPFGIQVSTLNPSFHRTPLVTSMPDELRKGWNALPEATRKEYGETYVDFFAGTAFSELVSRLTWKADVVAEQVVRWLCARDVPGMVLVGSDAKYLFILFRMLPPWILDKVQMKQPTPAVLLQQQQKQK